MENIVVRQIGVVRSAIATEKEDCWGNEQAIIELDAQQFTPDSLAGLAEFSHVEVLFHLHYVPETSVTVTTRHPRNNPQWPKVGIFAQRGKARPNRIGATICRIASVDGLKVTVSGLDAFDGTPVLDMKPVMAEFLPDRADIRQPLWSRELMQSYFAKQER
jgi:tRNA (adenine37-N6)-methyltransferase